MAEKASSFAATKKLEDQLTCSICLDQYIDPRTLQCLHSFCIKCLEGLPLHGDHSLSCPTCRTVVVIPEQGVATLPKAFHLNNFIEVQNLLKRTSGDKKAVCDNCTKQGAQLYCPECDKFICHSCNNVHKQWSSLSAHQVVGISEVSSKASQMVSVKPVPVMNCPSHNKPLDLYCVTCEQPICYLCTIKDHKGHTHDLISDAYDEGKTEIQKRVGSLVSRIEEKNEKKKDLQQSKNKAEREGNELKLSINEVCDRFVKKIESVRTLGLRSVDSGVLTFNKVEDQQIKEVDEELKALAGCDEHIKHILQMSTPTQLLATKKQTMTRIDQLIGPKEQEPEMLSVVGQVFKPAHESGLPDEMLSYDGIFKPSIYMLPVISPELPKKAVMKQTLSLTQSKNEVKIEDQAVDGLKNEIFSVIPFNYHESTYKQCEFVSNFPKNCYTSSTFTGTFSLLFQGQPMLVDKDDITCSFHNDDYGSINIPCKVDYIIEGDQVKYQVSFCTGHQGGYYSFILIICQVIIDTLSRGVKVMQLEIIPQPQPLSLRRGQRRN